MKRLLIIFLCLLCLLCFSGCREQTDTSCEIKPNITSFRNGNSVLEYYYIIDNNTGVVYLMAEGFYKCTLSAMLNRDGTPVTVDQLDLGLNNRRNKNEKKR